MERDELEYLEILKGLMELPFQVGKNLLIDFLSGNLKNKSVIKNQLDVLNGFGSLNWDSGRISNEIDKLIVSGMIEMVQSDYNRFVKVLGLSIKGRNEITNPTLPDKKLAKRAEFKETEISDEDRALFEEHGQFLKRFNDEYKSLLSELSSLSEKQSDEFLQKIKNIKMQAILSESLLITFQIHLLHHTIFQEKIHPYIQNSKNREP